MKDCKHDYENAIRKGRCHYHCPICDKDISLETILVAEAEDTKAKELEG